MDMLAFFVGWGPREGRLDMGILDGSTIRMHDVRSLIINLKNELGFIISICSLSTREAKTGGFLIAGEVFSQ